MRDSELLFRFLPWTTTASEKKWSADVIRADDIVPSWCGVAEEIFRSGQIEKSLDYVRRLDLPVQQSALRELIVAWGHIALGRNFQASAALDNLREKGSEFFSKGYLDEMFSFNRVMAHREASEKSSCRLFDLSLDLQNFYERSEENMLDAFCLYRQSISRKKLNKKIVFIKNRLVGSTLVFHVSDDFEYCVKITSSSSGFKLYTELQEPIILRQLGPRFARMHFEQTSETNTLIIMDWLTGEQVGAGDAGAQLAGNFKERLAKDLEFERFRSDIRAALSELSRIGVHYQDLWPDNIMYVDGKYKLIDFGFCRIMSPGEAERRNTVTLNELESYMKKYLL